MTLSIISVTMFQLTAARRRLAINSVPKMLNTAFQLTAARRRLVYLDCATEELARVSTHSRPKAAGVHPPLLAQPASGFNSQPPEGGW